MSFPLFLQSSSSDNSSCDEYIGAPSERQSEWETISKCECYRDFVRHSADSDLPVVITDIVAPFPVLYVNPAWERLCGFVKKDVVGKSLSLIQGSGTCRDTVHKMVGRMKETVAAPLSGAADAAVEVEVVANILNYKKNGEAFRNHIQLRHICNPAGRPTYFVGYLQNVEAGDNFRQQLVM